MVAAVRQTGFGFRSACRASAQARCPWGCAVSLVPWIAEYEKQVVQANEYAQRLLAHGWEVPLQAMRLDRYNRVRLVVRQPLPLPATR
jgi:hypothetical protein